MSGAFSAIGKVFKKVVSVVKKVLPIALAVGAIYFTAGAALGATGTWGTAVSALTKQMGATGLLGKVLTGAVTQAGYGAALGGGLSLITGGDMIKGIQRGAVTGAITGGVTGGLGLGDPLGEAIKPAEAATGAPEKLGMFAESGAAAAPQAATTTPTVGAAAAPATSTAGGNGLLGQGGWLERNQTLVGHGVQGVGTGLLNMAGAQSTAEATERAAQLRLDQDREERAATEARYANVGPGLLRPQDTAYQANQPGRPTPTERFDPRTYGGKWVYNPSVGQIVFVPNA